MTCFLERELARVLAEGQRPKLHRTFEDRHFFPQSWRCDLRTVPLNSYSLLRYSSQEHALFLDRLERLLAQQGVPKTSLAKIRAQLAQRTVHATAESEARLFLEQRLRRSPYLLEHLTRLYFHDFAQFGFPPPRFRFGEGGE